MTYPRVLAIAAATAAATMLLGWWSVAAVGIAGGLLRPAGRRAGLEAGAGGALGWAAILALSALSGPIWTVALLVGPVFRLPAPAFLTITIVFPALLAGSAAWLASEARRWSSIA